MNTKFWAFRLPKGTYKDEQVEGFFQKLAEHGVYQLQMENNQPIYYGRLRMRTPANERTITEQFRHLPQIKFENISRNKSDKLFYAFSPPEVKLITCKNELWGEDPYKQKARQHGLIFLPREMELKAPCLDEEESSSEEGQESTGSDDEEPEREEPPLEDLWLSFLPWQKSIVAGCIESNEVHLNIVIVEEHLLRTSQLIYYLVNCKWASHVCISDNDEVFESAKEARPRSSYVMNAGADIQNDNYLVAMSRLKAGIYPTNKIGSTVPFLRTLPAVYIFLYDYPEVGIPSEIPCRFWAISEKGTLVECRRS